MRMFHETNYVLYNNMLNDNIKICVISDLHFSNQMSNDKLNIILAKIKEIKPDYLFFCGDMIDSVGEVEKSKEKQRFLLWLKELSNISPFLVSLGSHDFFKYFVLSGKVRGKYFYPDLFNEMESYDNIYVLNNKSYSDNSLFVTGYTQSIDYYHSSNDGKLTGVRPKENKELMIKELQELKKNIGAIPKDKINFLLVHSPVYLKDNDVTKYINDYNYFISGHMHNGCVPPLLYEIWNSSYGLISPNKHLLQDNERNTLKSKNDKLIVNGPLTMFQKCSGKMQMFNLLYPIYLTNLILTPDNTYNTDKVYKKTKYSKW